jgi:hypothetical protein
MMLSVILKNTYVGVLLADFVVIREAIIDGCVHHRELHGLLVHRPF